jgi:hypothetical protein
MAFAFLLPMTIVGMALLWYVDTDKAVLETKEYLEDEARMLYKLDQENVNVENIVV